MVFKTKSTNSKSTADILGSWLWLAHNPTSRNSIRPSSQTILLILCRYSVAAWTRRKTNFAYEASKNIILSQPHKGNRDFPLRFKLLTMETEEKVHKNRCRLYNISGNVRVQSRDSQYHFHTADTHFFFPFPISNMIQDTHSQREFYHKQL